MNSQNDEETPFPEWSNFLGTREQTAKFVQKVVKRSGDVVNYDRNKIQNAIQKAIVAVEKYEDREKAEYLTDAVEEKLRLLQAGRHKNSIPAIEEIQDIVETVLIENKEVPIAKAYILYREHHSAIREARAQSIDVKKTIENYLRRNDWRVNENANINFSLGGLILHNSGSMTSHYWLNTVYPKEIANAHRSCAFHIHDLSMLSGYYRGAWRGKR